jgi:hypothetical protein
LTENPGGAASAPDGCATHIKQTRRRKRATRERLTVGMGVSRCEDYGKDEGG